MVSDAVDVFDTSSVPPLDGSKEFSLYLWEKIKARGIAPRWSGESSDDDRLRLEFLRGCRAYGLELVDLDDESELARLQAMRPPRYPLQPQQLRMADVLNATGLDDVPLDEYVIEVPRRASKTTTIFCWALGRCLSRPDYFVTFSAQSGVKGSARLREWSNRLDRVQPADDADLPPWLRGKRPKPAPQPFALFDAPELNAAAVESQGRGFRIMRGEVGKGIYFDNGSQFLVLKPDAESYRGEAGDISWIDEAQEIEHEAGEDLLAGIIPLQDTRPGAAVVVSGTAGEVRLGILWERVNRLRNGEPGIGGLDYAAAEDTPWEIIEDVDRCMELTKGVHPGVGTLTTIEKMRSNWHKLSRPKYAREYVSMWPETFGQTAINLAQWQQLGLAAKPKRPDKVAFGMDIKPGGSVAAIVAAWRNAAGVAYIEILAHRPGTDWIPEFAQAVTSKYRGSTIAYDDIGEGKATVLETHHMRPRPAFKMQTYSETAAGSVQILRDIERGKLRHADQTGFNEAVACAAKREVRGADRGVWLFTPARQGDDITPLIAAVKALRNWDQHYARNNQARLGVVAG